MNSGRNESEIRQLLESLLAGEQSIDAAARQLAQQSSTTTSIGSDAEVRLDVGRQTRCGFPEVVYAPGKTNEQIVTAFRMLQDADQNCLATRCDAEQAEAILSEFPEAIHHPAARTVRIQRHFEQTGKVAVITAGTSDRPVALEAVETLTWMNIQNDLFIDVGVAGPQRFLAVKDELADCDAVVVVAGMEGALPSMVAGWLSCPVVAVPTSVGYGASFSGVAALLSMLNSCASNVTVVNIDAGFKGGFVAGLIASNCHR
ncbi:nickel pincer cofactor biosynthesis protein LarB [Thalassoglobus sp. JC818]|uniref:nickel pincer cofactor biosynthesis protein LarB n=1 Tax=Thalassoglobus sp. JC818 TaxID=3232136 RepID=UPI00345A2C21